jgi:hypothetical protein
LIVSTGGPRTRNESSRAAPTSLGSGGAARLASYLAHPMKDPPAPPATLPAVWSIRTGAGPGDPGQVLAGGVADALETPTGRANEYQIAVSGLSLDLKPGVYFLQVSPISPTAGSMDFYVGARRQWPGRPRDARAGLPLRMALRQRWRNPGRHRRLPSSA